MADAVLLEFHGKHGERAVVGRSVTDFDIIEIGRRIPASASMLKLEARPNTVPKKQRGRRLASCDG